MVSFIAGLPGEVLSITYFARSPALGISDCNIAATRIFRAQSPVAAVDIVLVIIVSISYIITLYFFAATARELNGIRKFRVQCSLPVSSPMFVSNKNDKPIEWSIEAQTVKSLILFVVFHSICIYSSLVFFSILAASILNGTPRENPTSQALYIAALLLYILPAINPFLLLLYNKRYRRRIKELSTCMIKPEIHVARENSHEVTAGDH